MTTPPEAEERGTRIQDHDRVTSARAAMLPPGDAAVLAERFKLLADPGRISILSALSTVEDMCVRDLAAAVGATESSTSHQLKHLRLGGLVRSQKRGRSVHYSLADEHVRQLLNITAAHYLATDGSPHG